MRFEKLQKILKEKRLDGCFLDSENPNFKYYTGRDLMAGSLFIPSVGKPTIFVHRLEEMDHEFNIVPLIEKNTLRDFLKRMNLGKVGYDEDYTTAKDLYFLKGVSGISQVGQDLERLRMIKSEEEITHLENAVGIADEIMNELISNFDFNTEDEIRRFLKVEMAKRGVEKSFEPIVACERSAAIPHYFGSEKLKKGFLIIDMGVKVEGYCSDITRTFYIGTPSSEEMKLYGQVLQIQEECIRRSVHGTNCSAVYEYARENLGDRFVHGLGHGIGLKIHELPNLKSYSEDKFKDGMVFTIEPGWYYKSKRIGIRIEDDIALFKGKQKILTKTKKELINFSI